MEAVQAQPRFVIFGLVGEAIQLYGRFFIRFATLALVVFLPLDFFSAAASDANSDWGRGVWLIIAIIGGIVGFFLLQGALVLQADDLRDGRIDVSVREAFERTLPRLPYLVGTGFLVGIVVGLIGLGLAIGLAQAGGTALGILIALVITFFLMTRWLVASAVVMLEDARPVQALKRSWALVRGHSWRAFGLLIVTLIIAGIVGLIIGAIFSAVPKGFLRDWLSAAAVNTLTAPFLSLAWTLGYFRLRHR